MEYFSGAKSDQTDEARRDMHIVNTSNIRAARAAAGRERREAGVNG